MLVSVLIIKKKTIYKKGKATTAVSAKFDDD